MTKKPTIPFLKRPEKCAHPRQGNGGSPVPLDRYRQAFYELELGRNHLTEALRILDGTEEDGPPDSNTPSGCSWSWKLWLHTLKTSARGKAQEAHGHAFNAVVDLRELIQTKSTSRRGGGKVG